MTIKVQVRMKKRLFHRGYLIENSDGDPDHWKAAINLNAISGRLSDIKKSIDWWCDMKTFMPPERFNTVAKPQAQYQTEEYRGFKLINDSGKPNEWYITLRGQLLKGSTAAIKQHLDKVLLQLEQKK